MSTHNHIERPPFAAHTDKSEKRHAGRTDATHTPLDIRSHGSELNESLRDWIYERTGRQLGKFATQIERITVRFGDENGPKGGVDRSCVIEVSLSSLPNVIITEHGETDRAAFDRAAGRAERATRRSLERHGFSAKGNGKNGHAAPERDEFGAQDTEEHPVDGLSLSQADELAREDDGLQNGGNGKLDVEHTADRNVKLNTEGMTYALEDSTNGQASRKSTRASANRIKTDNALSRRTKDALHTPQSKAERGRGR